MSAQDWFILTMNPIIRPIPAKVKMIDVISLQSADLSTIICQ